MLETILGEFADDKSEMDFSLKEFSVLGQQICWW